jgi:RNA polymerase sigma factor (sigma-70 family)
MKQAEDGFMGSQTVALMIRATRAEVTDRELLRRFATGDQAAFAALVRRHTEFVMGVCRRSLATVQDAEDACQATFLILARKAKATRWQPSIANWLHATARRVAQNARRSVERRARRERRAAVPEATTPIDAISGRELVEMLDAELGRLPPIYREPLILCYLAGLTRDEAAARLQLPAATLKTRLDRARKCLALALTRRGCALGIGLLALAVTSRAEASPPRLLDSILVAVSGSPSPAAAALVEGVAMNGSTMRSSLLAAAAVGLALLGAGVGLAPRTAAHPTPEQPNHPPLTREARPASGIPVSGRVLGPDGKPIAGAKFAVIDDEDGAVLAGPSSAEDGRFAFALPYPPTVRNPRQVVASAPGLGLDWLSEPRDDAVFRLVADAPITGRVIDLQGKPVAGATVAVANIYAGPPGAFDAFLEAWKKSAKDHEHAEAKLDRHLFNRGGLGQVLRVTTDRDGAFTFTGLGKDRVVTLLVSGPGIAHTYAAVATRPGIDLAAAPRGPTRLNPPAFTLAVAPDKPITGVVRDEQTQKPVPGVRVVGAAQLAPLHFGGYPFHAWPTPATVTDKEGRFTLRGLAKAKAYVLVADPDEGTEHLHRFDLVRDTDGFDPITTGFSLPRGVVLSGRVTDTATGAGVASRVFYRPLLINGQLGNFGGYDPPDYPAPWHRGRDTKTDFDGRYKITVMPGAGVVNFQAYGGSYQRARAAKQEIDAGIVDKQFGHFRTIGQGGHFNPESMNAYKIINPAPTDRTATLDVTYTPEPKTKGK